MPQPSKSAHSVRPGNSGLWQWPDIHVVEIGRRGMVFRSRRAFDLGDSLDLGVHFCFAPRDSAPELPAGNDFLRIEGVVVDCRVVSWGSGERVFEITLLFPSVDESECALLVAASRRRSLDPPSAHQDDEPLDDEARGFDRITGFN